MLPDRVSNPGPLTYESGALPIALSGPASESVLFTLIKQHDVNSIASDQKTHPSAEVQSESVLFT